VNESSERVGPGVVGELVVRGPHVMRGYWERDEETARALRPGPLPGERVLHTGDLFTMDAEGCLYFVSRKDDIIKTRGEKVSPKEVETVIASLPGVAEAAVVGMPDPVLGEAVKAIVVVRAGAKVSAQDVLRHCAGRLETFMIPKLVEFRESLPHTPNGKVNKRELRLQAAGEVPS
jgi:long-chain acyl-CoA synthetase